MRKSLTIALLFLFLMPTSYPKIVKHKKKSSNTTRTKKFTAEDAKELCLLSMGASIKEDELKKCIEEVQKTGKIDGKKISP